MEALDTSTANNGTSVYSEFHLKPDGSIAGHLEDGDGDVIKPTYTLDQAKALMAALGYIIYQAEILEY